MIETQREKTKTIYEVVEDIVQLARATPRDWAKRFCTHAGIEDGSTLQQAVQALSDRADHGREYLQPPEMTAFHGGDIDDLAVLAICLAECLELPYEIRIKGGNLFLYVHGIEVLHKS